MLPVGINKFKVVSLLAWTSANGKTQHTHTHTHTPSAAGGEVPQGVGHGHWQFAGSNLRQSKTYENENFRRCSEDQ